jgi:hypothetical protein
VLWGFGGMGFEEDREWMGVDGDAMHGMINVVE